MQKILVIGCCGAGKSTFSKKLEKILKLPLVVCRSKSGGAHIFLFSTKFIEEKIMRDKLLEIRAILGFANAEVFPKQIELKSEIIKCSIIKL